MASGPDLFVVCKSCGSEVSPYITECPYCGTRLRKRAPKLERGGTPKPPKRSRPRLAPLRRGEIPGIRPDRRPYVTILIVLASVVVTLVGWIGLNLIADETLNGLGLSTVAAWGELALGGPFDGEWWKLWTTQLVYGSTGYEVAALSAIALFGTLLERRHGWWAPLMVFVIGGGAGMALVVAADEGAIAVGGNAAALAMLAAWSMRDILGRRAGREDDADLLGVLAIAVLLVLLPLVDGRRQLARRARRRTGRHRAGPRPRARPLSMARYTDEQVEAAIELLSDPARLEEAQRMVGANAPGIQRILNEALQAADWFGSAHQAAVLEAAGKPDVDERLAAVRTLIAEETGVSMLIGVAVGYELAHELMRQED